MLDDSMFQDRGTISSDCLLVGLGRGSYIIRMSKKATLVFHDHLQQSFKFCELGALDQPVKIHLLQDVEAGELLAPLVLVQSRQHPGNVKLTVLSVEFFQCTCSWVDLLRQVWCRSWHSSKQSGAQSRG